MQCAKRSYLGHWLVKYLDTHETFALGTCCYQLYLIEISQGFTRILTKSSSNHLLQIVIHPGSVGVIAEKLEGILVSVKLKFRLSQNSLRPKYLVSMNNPIRTQIIQKYEGIFIKVWNGIPKRFCISNSIWYIFHGMLAKYILDFFIKF